MSYQEVGVITHGHSGPSTEPLFLPVGGGGGDLPPMGGMAPHLGPAHAHIASMPHGELPLGPSCYQDDPGNAGPYAEWPSDNMEWLTCLYSPDSNEDYEALDAATDGGGPLQDLDLCYPEHPSPDVIHDDLYPGDMPLNLLPAPLVTVKVEGYGGRGPMPQPQPLLLPGPRDMDALDVSAMGVGGMVGSDHHHSGWLPNPPPPQPPHPPSMWPQVKLEPYMHNYTHDHNRYLGGIECGYIGGWPVMDDGSGSGGEDCLTSPGDDDASKRMDNKKCGVCGDRALGYNFNAITCESCKAFFRRNALKNKEFRCPFNDSCKVDQVTRRFCQKCRLRKCFDIGMKKEWIMTDEEKQRKKQKIEENRVRKLDTTDDKKKPLIVNHFGNLGHNDTSKPQAVVVGIIRDEEISNKVLRRDPHGDVHSQGRSSSVLSNSSDTDYNLEYESDNTKSPASPLLYDLTSRTDSTNKIYQSSNQPISISDGGPLRDSTDVFNTVSPSVQPYSSTQTILTDLDRNQDGIPASSSRNSSSGIYGIINRNSFRQCSPDPHTPLYTFPHITNNSSLTTSFTSNIPSTAVSALPFTSNIPSTAVSALPLASNHATILNNSIPVNTSSAAVIQPFSSVVTPVTSFPSEQHSPIIQTVDQHDISNRVLPNIDTSFEAKSSLNMQVSGNSIVGEVSAPPVTMNSIMGVSIKQEVEYGEEDLFNCQDAAERSSSDTPKDPKKLEQDTWKNFSVHDALRIIQPGCKNKKTDSSGLTMMDNIMETAITAEYSAFSLLAAHNNPRELNEPEKLKLAELCEANKGLMAPLSEDYNFKDLNNPSLINIINLTEIAIRRLIKTSKRISAFKSLCQEDQIALLKGGCTEMMILRSVSAYDPDKDAWKIQQDNDQFKNIKLKVLKSAPGNIYEEHKKFNNGFRQEWRQDPNMIFLLCAITLFNPERANIIHADAIKHEQCSYLYLLKRYLECKYGGCEGRTIYYCLLERINHLHILNENHVRVFLEVDPQEVEPLLIEIFDLKQR